MIETDAVKPAQNKWFLARRDFFFTNMVKGFHQTLSVFLKLYQDYLATGAVPYDEIDRLVGSETRKGCLWCLKDECHRLWRADVDFELNGSLLDWIVGSVFHEAMKLKENIYLFEYYAPLAHDIKGGWQEARQFCGIEFAHFMKRISHEADRQMEYLGLMLGRAIYLLRTMLPSEAHNRLLLRYLLEHPDVVSELWYESLDEVFADMFAGSPEQGYCLAAASYFAGNWYEKAQTAYKEALRLNKACEEAMLGTGQLKAILDKTGKEQQENLPQSGLMH